MTLTGARSRSRRPLGVVVVIAVLALTYASYRANDGIPFVPSDEVSIVLPSAPRLNKNAAVRVAGTRIGQVADVRAVPSSADSPAHAVVRVRLSTGVGLLPVDTGAQVRPASVLGASYLDLSLGASSRTVPDGGTLRPEPLPPAVQPTDLLDVFDRSTRAAIRRSTAELGSGVAGRGSALGASFGSVAELLSPATRVLGVAGAPESDLRGFLVGARRSATAFEAVAPELGPLVSNAATTATAVAVARDELDRALSRLPSSERAATTALRALAPALRDVAQASADLRPATRSLPQASRRLAELLTTGRRTLPVVPGLSARLRTVFVALDTAAQSDSLDGTVRKVRDAVVAATPLLRALAPAQEQCNLIALWARNLGTGAYALPNGPMIVNLVFHTLGAENELFQNAAPSSNVGINTLPHQNADECEANNEQHDGLTQTLDNPPGLQMASTRETAPPAGVRERAARAGLLSPIGPAR